MLSKITTTIGVKIMLALLASLLAVAAIQTLRVSWGHNREKALSEALRTSQANLAITNKSTGATAAATSLTRAAQAAARKEANEARQELDAAITAAPDWADMPIPAGVLASLRDKD